jgi:hypothetical protein
LPDVAGALSRTFIIWQRAGTGTTETPQGRAVKASQRDDDVRLNHSTQERPAAAAMPRRLPMRTHVSRKQGSMHTFWYMLYSELSLRSAIYKLGRCVAAV